MERPEVHYYALNRFLLSISGLWPYQSARNARLIRAIHIVILLSSAFIQLASAFTSEITADYVIDFILTFMPTLGGFLHMYARVRYIDKLRELFDRMWDDWALQKTNDEIKIMYEHTRASRRLTFYISLQIYITIMGYNIWLCGPEILDIISPMNESRPRIQPFRIEYFIDEERYFYIIRSHTCIVMFFMPIIYIASCSVFIVFTQHVCGMCELLGYRTERLFYVVENTASCDLIRGMKISHRNNMAILIQLHYSVIQFVGIIEAFQTIPFLIDFTGIVIMLSLTLMQILSISGNVELAIRCISYTITQLIYLFLLNYMAQRITDKTSSVCENVYNCMWYDAIVSDQKSLLLIMRQCFRPLVLTGCKIYMLSLQNFGMTAISYCMLLRQI